VAKSSTELLQVASQDARMSKQSPLLSALGALLLAGWTTPLRADLSVPQPIHNAGFVYTGQDLEHRFVLQNPGPEEIELLGVQASCGCLRPELDKRMLKSGEAGSVLLKVHTFSQAAGPRFWKLTVTYRSGTEVREALLQLTATLIAEVSLQPAALVVPVDKLDKHEFVFTDRRDQPLTFTAVRTSLPQLTATVADPRRTAAGHWTRSIRLVAGADLPDGKHTATLSVYTSDPKYPELAVPVTVIKGALERLSVLPADVSLTATGEQPVPARLVRLRDRDNQPVQIERIISDDPAIACTWAPGPGSMATLKIQIDRKQFQGNLDSAVHVFTSAPIREKITIPIRCRVE
jgi:hypothetical protein